MCYSHSTMKVASTCVRKGEAPGDLDELADFPVAVLCARCGRAECAGCEPVGRASDRDATVAIPWETEAPGVRGLWQTARLVTVDGRSFFGSVKSGSLGRAAAFALGCELVAVGSLLGAWWALMLAVFPAALDAVVGLAPSAWLAVGATTAAAVVVAALMVVLHAVWATSLELGLLLSGHPTEIRRALSYALYSCGWDLITSPFGLGAGLLTGGPQRALQELRRAVTIPGEATRAYLQVARHAPEPAARRSIWVAATITGGLVFLTCAGALALIVAAYIRT